MAGGERPQGGLAKVCQVGVGLVARKFLEGGVVAFAKGEQFSEEDFVLVVLEVDSEQPGVEQVWSPAQFYTVDFSQPRIGVTSKVYISCC